MPSPGRKRVSFVLLLTLAAGLVVAGAAAAASLDQMACCPAGASATASGCTWLGAGDCCPERPAAPAPPHAAPPAPPACTSLSIASSATAPALLPPGAAILPAPPRTSVLRL